MLKDKIRSVNARLWPGHVFIEPKWVVLGVNNVCNLHCKMCDVGTQNLESNFAQNLVGTHPLNMPIELIKKVIDQTAKYWPNSKLAYAFTEPLVYPHLIESLHYAQKHNLYTTVTTNALTLKQKAQGINDAGLDQICVSLDGPESIHNEIRGNKKSFQKALEGIKELEGLNSSVQVDVICAITEWNIGYLETFLDQLADYNIHEVFFMHTQFNDPELAREHNVKWESKYPATASNLDEVNLENMDIPKLVEEVKSIKSKRWPFKISFSPELNSREDMNGYYFQPKNKFVHHCSAVFNSVMVKSDGSVIPAHGRCFNLTVGNLYEHQFSEIWNSEKFSVFRKDLMNAGGLFEGCSRCCSAV